MKRTGECMNEEVQAIRKTNQSLRAARLCVALACVVLLNVACGGTISAPSDEQDPAIADIGPQLSYKVMQADVTGVSEIPAAYMGYSVAIGDFNRDGRRDIATGIPGRDGGMVAIRQSTGVNGYWNYYVRPPIQDRTGDDGFGWSLAAGDFDADGSDDLAIGAPTLDLNGNIDAGEAFVMYGSPAVGLTNRITRIAQGQDGAVEPGDLLGWSLASGDFNADGYADLAVGAPGENFNGTDAGAVLIRWGSPGGLDRAFSPTLLTHPEPQAHSQFGYSLATGHFQSAYVINGNMVDDLAIGSPFRDVTEYSASQHGNIVYEDAGEIMFYWGSRSNRIALSSGTRLTDRRVDQPRFGWAMSAGRFVGLDRDQLAVGAPHFHDERGYVAIVNPLGPAVLYRLDQPPDGITEAGDRFGYALAAGNFDNDGFEDLAIGAPSEGPPQGSGAVYIRFGSANGLIASNDILTTATSDWAYFITQKSAFSNREALDGFGAALAAGDLNNDGNADLAIGSPTEDLERAGGTLEDVGVLFVALSRAPAFGPFRGRWTGTISGDSDSSAPFTLRLNDTNRIVTGSATMASPGIVMDVNEVCAPRDDDDENGTGGRTILINAVRPVGDPSSLTETGTLNVGGFQISYELRLRVSLDGMTMTAELEIIDPTGELCGGNRTFTATLTKVA